MKKSIEFKLAASRSDCKALLKLMDKGKNIYNLALSECKKRLNKIHSDAEYQGLLIQRKELKKNRQSTKDIDTQLREIIKLRHKLTKTDFEKFIKDNAGYLMEGFNSQFAQVLADRAFDAIIKILYGKAKSVRFKGKHDNILVSLNSKSTDTGILFNPDTKAIVYRQLKIPLVLKYRNDYGYHDFYLRQIIDNIALHDSVDISYIRIVRRIIKGWDVFYVQFVIDTRAFGMTDEKAEEENLEILKHNSELIDKAVTAEKTTNRLKLRHFVSNIIEYPKTNKTIEMIRSLGLCGQFKTAFDMGPKHMAVFLKNEQYSIAVFQPIFNKLVEYNRELRILQRKLDKQRRNANPKNYNADGTIRKGIRLIWKRSKGYINTQAQVRELHRLVKATRKTVLNELSNIIVAMGNRFSAEDVSYRSWQQNYGKSVGSYAPSQFINTVYSKAESAGSEIHKLPLRNALSQLCVCGIRHKKKLSQRLHECTCGCIAQRDILSAYLGLFCNPNSGEWEGETTLQHHNADRQLLTASHWIYRSQAASRHGFGFALLLDKGRQSCSCGNEDRHPSEVHGGVMIHKDLKSLVKELGLNNREIARLSSGIPCL